MGVQEGPGGEGVTPPPPIVVRRSNTSLVLNPYARGCTASHLAIKNIILKPVVVVSAHWKYKQLKTQCYAKMHHSHILLEVEAQLGTPLA